MLAVKMNRAMRPYGQGDVAVLPEDVANKIVADGAAAFCALPSAPHAHEGGSDVDQAASRKPASGRPRRTYLTKEGRGDV